MNEKPVSEKNKSDEVEMSDFLRLLGKLFTKIGNTIAWVFVGLYDLLIIFFLFLKRKAIWLGLAIVLGLAFGFYMYFNEGAVYKSEMVTKSNFESSYFLYNLIENLNSLKTNNNYTELSKIFNITPAEAESLVNFKVEPVENDIEAAKLYRQTFLQTKRNHNYVFDTIWSRTLKFDAFKKQLTTYDYPLNKITVRSKSSTIFPKIEQGILNTLNNDPELKEKKENFKQVSKLEEVMLESALTNIDTLRQVYNKKLVAQNQNLPGGSNQLILGERDIRNPELDLYDKAMLIKDELIELKARSLEEKEPLVLHSGLGTTGSKESFTRKVGMPALFALAFAFSILLIIEFVKYLIKVEKRKMA